MSSEYRVPVGQFSYLMAEAFRIAQHLQQDDARYFQCWSETDRILKMAIESGAIKPVETTLSYPVDPSHNDAHIKLSEVVAYGKANGIWWGGNVSSLAKALGFTIPESPTNAQTNVATQSAHVPAESAVPAASGPPAAPAAEAVATKPSKKETQKERQARRYRQCIDAGLEMPTDDYPWMPRGISAVAEKEGISRQAYVEDVKHHINRTWPRSQ